MKITAQQLEEFASKSVAKDLLPELIRRLIRATADRVEDVSFPSGESTFRPGADGLLRVATGKPPYVPEGVSFWELSANKDPHQKGRDDFDKRSKPREKDEYLGKTRSEITYVAVSLRRWNTVKKVDRDGLETEQRNKKVWKDVKILDAEHLEDWLDRSPTVSAWLARRMQIVSPDMKSIEDFWQDYRTGITPQMSQELLLLSRQQKADELVAAAVRGDLLRVKADSPKEAAAFVAAAILSLPLDDPRREALLAKGVVITRPEADAFLSDTNQKLFVIALERATDIATQLAGRGHTVVAAYGNSHTSRGSNSALIELRRPKRDELAKALEEMGMDEKSARNRAAECHCSITVLYRLGDGFHSRRPEWDTPQQLGKLLGPMLCGAYKHLRPADAEVVASVAGMPEEQVEENVREVLYLDDAPVRREGDLTALSAPADIWQLGLERGLITRPVLDRFRIAAIKVLGEHDPALDLPIEKRAFANMEGKTLTHSASLRSGIAEILRLIAINGKHLDGLGGGFSAQHFVDGILREVPGLEMNYQMLASLDSLLPDLAEAAPDPFLSALETLSAGDGSKLSPIFEGSDDAFFGKTYYLGTLRALEMLAWDPAYLVRVTQTLGRLAELDPGGRLSNRPINSLIQIFLPWMPRTNASQQARHVALQKVCEAFPTIAWKLLAGLLPQDHAISFGTAEPEWREMGASQRPVPTYGSAAKDWEFIVQSAIPLAAGIPSRWIDLMEAAATSKDEKLLDKLLDQISAQSAEFFAQKQDKELWEAMSALANKHRAFESAKWAMPSSMIKKIESTASKFEPKDPIAFYRHLFNSSIIERLNANETYEQRKERGEHERDTAISEVSKQGIEAIIDLARQVKTPGLLAPSIVRTSNADQVRAFVLASFDKDEPIGWLAAQVMTHAVSHFGVGWGIETLEQVEAAGATSTQVATLLRLWDDTPELFALVDSKSAEVRSEYWRTRDSYVRSNNRPLVEQAVKHLIENGRSVDLISFVGSSLANTDTQTLIQIVARAIDEVVAEPARIQAVETYWLKEILEALRKRPEADRNELMSLEYRWFPALHSYGEPQTFALHEHLGESPEFFVKILSDLYRADTTNDDDTEESEPEADVDKAIDEQARGRADIAYKLLESWQSLPWQGADGKLDVAQMLEWVREALRLAKAAGRLHVAEREIGKLLAYGSVDPEDEVWPIREVRDVIEALANTEVEDSLVMELFNKRGVHWRPPEGGGEPERALAQRANEAADKLQAVWPRTSRVLRESAKDWLYHAEREDRRAAEKRISL